MIIGVQTGGPLIPLSAIVSAKSVKGGWRVKTVDGDLHDVSNSDWEIAVETSPMTSFPAAPGTYLLEVCTEENGYSILRNTVLGWGVTYAGLPMPVVLDPEATVETKWSIQQPDGRVERADGRQWASADAWLAEVTEDRKEG